MARGLLHFLSFNGDDVDAQVIRPAQGNFAARNTGYANEPPLQHFLKSCYEEFKPDNSGTVADYIPELKRANPAHFGVALVTIDGHVYEVGDSAVPFTIQSVSKAFVFALALDMVGEERVSAAIGVEPSGEAFNSIRLTNDNRPFNPMVNAGAIACSGLIHQADGAHAFERIREKLSQFAGRELDVDDAVHASESAHRQPQSRDRLAVAQLPGAAGRRRCGARYLFPAMRHPRHRARSRRHGGDARQSRRQSRDGRSGHFAQHRGAHALGHDQFGHVRLCRRVDLSCRHSRQERRRRRHRRSASLAIGARHLLAVPRQPWQQRARPEGLRSAFVAASTCICSTEAPMSAPASSPTTTFSASRRAAAASRTSSRFWTSATATSG